MDKNTKYFMLIAAAAVAVTAVLCIASVGQTDPSDADTVSSDGSVSASVSLSSDTSGRCGNNLIWEYDTDTKTLIISGSGAMSDYISIRKAPWFDYLGDMENILFPEGLTHIGQWAFYGCSSLTSVTIPDSVKSIGDYTFRNCAKLAEFNVDPNNACFSSEDGVLFDKEKTALIIYPAGKELTSVTIPDSVTWIDDEAFFLCTSVTSVTIPDSVTWIGYRAFYCCKSLTSVTIGSSVESIDDEAFCGCTVLASVTTPGSAAAPGYLVIPDSVESIGRYAFSDCSSLTSVTIGSSVTSIGGYAFLGCPVEEVYNHSDLDIKPGSCGLPQNVNIIKCDD